ncbi:hypothetical protein [Ferrovibrio terrae]|uniref:hypothetical protein n=1 Tax=Ferrovibrio terrae TaxID=2594003 RepID=UPI00313821B8
MRLPAKASQWVTLAVAVLSAGWFCVSPDFEPAIALVASLGGLYTAYKPQNSVPIENGVTGVISGVGILGLVRNAYNSDIPSIVKDNIDAVAFISPADAVEVLELAYISDRPKILFELAKKIKPLPTDGEANRILNLLYISDRPKGAKAIASIR